MPCKVWRERPLYWSTIGYVRSWWATDGVRLATIQKYGMKPDMLRSLGDEYNVNRSIVRNDKSRGAPDANAQAICNVLHEACLFWPGDLIGRATACEGIAAGLRGFTGKKEKNLVSAATKFMWFLRPDGWTVFDSFAARGMGVGSHLSRVEQLARFYRNLDGAGFSPLVLAMQQEIARSALPALPSARVLDTLFMARGGRGGDASAIEDLGEFLALLPTTTRDVLETLAMTLHGRFGTHELANPDRAKSSRRRKTRS